jgi:hypothetical protein
MDADGCIDDTDNDGVVDSIDDCLETLQDTPVKENGCTETNDIPQIFFDTSSLIGHNNSSIPLQFSVLDDDTVDVNIALQRSNGSLGIVEICTRVVENDSWIECIVDVENSFFPLSPDGEWVVVISAVDRNTSWWAETESNLYESPSFVIEVYTENDVKTNESPGWILTSIVLIIALALLLSTILQFVNRERHD